MTNYIRASTSGSETVKGYEGLGPVFNVCTGPECSKKCGPDLARDIEELAAGRCDIRASGCLDHCGKGPNIDVIKNNKKTTYEGIVSFKAAEKLLKSEGGVKPTSIESQVASLKYEARRISDSNQQSVIIEKAFKALGGQAKAETSQPRLTAELLVMRARAFLERDAATAMKNAEKALELFPGYAAAHASIAAALEAMGRWQEAQDALHKAEEIGGVCLDLKQLAKVESRCKEHLAKEKEEAAKADAEKKAKEEEEAKKKAEEEKKKQVAAGKAAAKKRAAEAKKKAEAEKKKAEEEAKAKAEQEAADALAEQQRLEAEAQAKADDDAKAACEAAAAAELARQEEEKLKAEQDAVAASEQEATAAQLDKKGIEDAAAVNDGDMPSEPQRVSAPGAAKGGSWWSFGCCAPSVGADASGAADVTHQA